MYLFDGEQEEYYDGAEFDTLEAMGMSIVDSLNGCWCDPDIDDFDEYYQ